MIIVAKFAAVCPCCSSRIAIGSRVEWSRGAKAVHATCGGKPVSAPATGVRSTTYRRREPMGAGRGSAPAVPGYSSYCTDNACRCYDCAS